MCSHSVGTDVQPLTFILLSKEFLGLSYLQTSLGSCARPQTPSRPPAESGLSTPSPIPVSFSADFNST